MEGIDFICRDRDGKKQNQANIEIAGEIFVYSLALL